MNRLDYQFFIGTEKEVISFKKNLLENTTIGFNKLVGQEIFGEKNEITPETVRELLRTFGFEWEPISEAGHLRYLSSATFMVRAVEQYAADVAKRNSNQLEIPFFSISNTNIFDMSSTLMKNYLELTAAEPGLYGDMNYVIHIGDEKLLLRQTSCIGKYSVCKSWPLKEINLPLCIFEISDSYRHELEENLELCFRIRKFRLPEAHIMTKDMEQAIIISLKMHEYMMAEILSLGGQYEVLISTSHNFFISNQDYIKKLASITKKPVLVKVYPQNSICEDGMEIDVEYKIIDSLGCPREFNCFQIDEQMTKTFGITYLNDKEEDATPVTIHTVWTGSIERFIYFILDRIAFEKQNGHIPHLPIWIMPIICRIIPAYPDYVEKAAKMAEQLINLGLRIDIDDREKTLEDKINDADSELIPYIIVVKKNVKNESIAFLLDRVQNIEKECNIIVFFLKLLKNGILKRNDGTLYPPLSKRFIV